MRHLLQIAILLFFATFLTGCELVGDIFSAGMYTGIFIVVLVIVLIIFVVVKMGKGK
jgi:hypothetical protein